MTSDSRYHFKFCEVDPFFYEFLKIKNAPLKIYNVLNLSKKLNEWSQSNYKQFLYFKHRLSILNKDTHKRIYVEMFKLKKKSFDEPLGDSLYYILGFFLFRIEFKYNFKYIWHKLYLYNC